MIVMISVIFIISAIYHYNCLFHILTWVFCHSKEVSLHTLNTKSKLKLTSSMG